MRHITTWFALRAIAVIFKSKSKSVRVRRHHNPLTYEEAAMVEYTRPDRFCLYGIYTYNLLCSPADTSQLLALCPKCLGVLCILRGIHLLSVGVSFIYDSFEISIVRTQRNYLCQTHFCHLLALNMLYTRLCCIYILVIARWHVEASVLVTVELGGWLCPSRGAIY